MASLWAKERASAALDEWVKNTHAKLHDILAEALDRAEVYGFQRGFDTSHELGTNEHPNG